MLMKTKFYINSGMFTEKFFFGEEDIDYALRLKKQQAKVACVPCSIIYHKVGSSLAGDMNKLTRKAFIHYVNRFINMKSHLGFIWYLWLIPAVAKMVLNLHKYTSFLQYKTFLSPLRRSKLLLLKVVLRKFILKILCVQGIKHENCDNYPNVNYWRSREGRT